MEKQAAEKAKLAEGTSSEQSNQAVRQPPSPEALLEEISLQQAMDKNKESLKRKLMLRRSVNELVDRGIYPPLKTPPAFAEQSKALERAKTGDLLRHKIQTRPDRQSLVQQHILEDTKIDPSLHARQRLLKKARLTDDLNVKLANRPGPLELVEENILQTNDKLVEAIKAFNINPKNGSLAYSRINELDDVVMQPQHFMFDEESISDGIPSPPQDDSSFSDISSPGSMPPPVSEPFIQMQKSPPVSAILDMWMEQTLDHFNDADTRTWQQRYFVNDKYFDNYGPVFLMIGGEGEASPVWMVEGMWTKYAKQFNAKLFQLEHRFYGKSHPTPDMSTDNLMYLSSEQALADLAAFIQFAKEKYNLHTNTWITFGGSYPDCSSYI